MDKTRKKEILRFIKFGLFSISAGVIQIISFTLLNEVAKLSYLPSHLISVFLSVVWNFTFNRKFTFKSANNVPIAMLKVVGYYALFFLPFSMTFGDLLVYVGWHDFLVEAIMMIVNFVTEFFFTKYWVYGKSTDSAVKVKDAENVDNSIENEEKEDNNEASVN